MWRARSVLPAAVESTAQLVSADLIDTRPDTSTLNKRMIMSMSILRMVNGLVDVHQKRAFAQSVNAIAARIRLPRLLVDLRHQSTHNSLPSVSTLRLALRLALDWLDAHYWRPQAEERRVRTGLNEFDPVTSIVDFQTRFVRENRKRKGRDYEKDVQAWCAAMITSAQREHNTIHRTAESSALRRNENAAVSSLLDAMTRREDEPTSKATAAREYFEPWIPVIECLTTIWSHFCTSLLLASVRRVRRACDDGEDDDINVFVDLAQFLIRTTRLWPQVVDETFAITRSFPIERVAAECVDVDLDNNVTSHGIRRDRMFDVLHTALSLHRSSSVRVLGQTRYDALRKSLEIESEIRKPTLVTHETMTTASLQDVETAVRRARGQKRRRSCTSATKDDERMLTNVWSRCRSWCPSALGVLSDGQVPVLSFAPRSVEITEGNARDVDETTDPLDVSNGRDQASTDDESASIPKTMDVPSLVARPEDVRLL